MAHQQHPSDCACPLRFCGLRCSVLCMRAGIILPIRTNYFRITFASLHLDANANRKAYRARIVSVDSASLRRYGCQAGPFSSNKKNDLQELQNTVPVVLQAVIVCLIKSLPSIALPPLLGPLRWVMVQQGFYYCYQERIYQESLFNPRGQRIKQG